MGEGRNYCGGCHCDIIKGLREFRVNSSKCALTFCPLRLSPLPLSSSFVPSLFSVDTRLNSFKVTPKSDLEMMNASSTPDSDPLNPDRALHYNNVCMYTYTCLFRFHHQIGCSPPFFLLLCALVIRTLRF